MNKVGIVSINLYIMEPNYGSCLQTFGLYSAISSLGYDVDVIDYRPFFRKDVNLKWGWVPWGNWWSMINYIWNLSAALRKWRDYISFFEKRMTLSEKTDWASFDLNNYDLYVVGSDTVWNIRQTSGFEPAYFGAYKCMKKLIAYAPSFGDATYNDDEARKFQHFVNRFYALSVREPVNLAAFGSLSSRVRTVLDPTMLFVGEWYEKLVIAPKVEERYLFLYQLYYDDAKMIAKVDSFARKHGLKIIDASKFRYRAHPTFFKYLIGALQFFNVRKGSWLMPVKEAVPHDMRMGLKIGEWLGLIRDAEYVVTNSFHGTIFSILFKRNFTCFSRPDATSKMKSLCRMVGLEDRFTACAQDITDSPIDYDGVVFPKLANLRLESWKYLKSALEEALTH